MKRYGCLWLLWLFASVGNAQPSKQPVSTMTAFDDASGEVSLRGQLYRFVDSTGKLTVRRVIEQQRAGRFQRATSLTNRQDFGYNTTDAH